MFCGPQQSVLLVHRGYDGWSAETTFFHVHGWLVLVAQGCVSVQLFLGDRLGALLNLVERELDVFDLNAGVVRELRNFMALLQHVDDVLQAKVGQPRSDRRLKLGPVSVQFEQGPDVFLEVVKRWLRLVLSLSSYHASNN